jgi:type IV pilus assembly protein PilP
VKKAVRTGVGGGLCMLVAGLLTGCAADFDELQGWIDSERRAVQPRLNALQPPRPFNPEAYEGSQTVEPFSTQKLTVAVRQESAAQPNSAMAAELNRRKEPLEAFPLDAMTMVGSLSRQGRAVALLRVDSLLYMVRPGDYLGQNYGRVTKVDEARVEIRELVQDATGEWVTRPAVLHLQDKAR